METLRPELLACICEHLDTLPDLLALRAVDRRFRDVVDRFGEQPGYRFCRSRILAFDDALLAVRLARIPCSSRPHFLIERKEYSFIPTQEFFQAVMQGRPVPEGCPPVPPVTWIEELAAVTDLYLLALAWQSTSERGINQGNFVLMTGTWVPDLGSLADTYTEAFVRSFFRIQVFTSIFGPRIFAEPVLSSIETFASLLSDISIDTDVIPDEILKSLRRFPMYASGDLYDAATAIVPFRGFFEWLYTQPQPTNLDFCQQVDASDGNRPPPSYLSESKRQQVALLQLLKMSLHLEYRMLNQRLEGTPSDEAHTRALYNPMYAPQELFPIVVYRPKLPISCFSIPRAIISVWAEAQDTPSIVVECHHSPWSSIVATHACRTKRDGEGPIPFFGALEAELFLRFGKKFEEERVDFLPRDGGLLWPLGEARTV